MVNKELPSIEAKNFQKNLHDGREPEPEGLHDHRGRLPRILQGPVRRPEALRGLHREAPHPQRTHSGQFSG